MNPDLGFQSIRLNYLFVDEYTFPASWIYPTSAIPYSMLRLILHGRAIFTIDGEDFAVAQDEIVYIPQGCQLSCRALEDDFTFISIRFSAGMPLDDVEIRFENLGLARITACADGLVHEFFRTMVRSRKSAEAGKMFRLKGYLELIVAWLVDAAAMSAAAEDACKDGSAGASALGTTGDAPPGSASGEAVAQGAGDASMPICGQPGFARSLLSASLHDSGPVLKLDMRVQRVVEYLTKHPDENLDVQSMCTMTGLSESSLRRVFKANTGKSPMEFMTEMRMIAAARRLLATDDRISEIAYDLGYSDPNYFIRCFHRNFGITPRRYRVVSRG